MLAVALLWLSASAYADGPEPVAPAFDQNGWTLSNTTDGRLTWLGQTGPQGTMAAKIDTLRECPHEWDIQFLASTTQPVKTGDTLLLSCWARNPEGPHGMAARLNLIFQLINPPYSHSLSTGLVVQSDWVKIDLPFKARYDFAAGMAKCNIETAFMPQTVEIAGLQVVDYGPDISVDSLPHMANTYEGREPNAAWRAEAEARIDKIRKAKLTVDVVNAAGRPVKDAAIAVRMRRHAFLFGTAMTEQILDPSKRGAPDGKEYEQILASRFNGVTAGMLTWKHWVNPYWRRETLMALDQVRAMGFRRIHGAHLVWGNWKYVDPAVKQQYDALHAADPNAARDYLKSAIDRHIVEVMTQLMGKVSSYNVVNENHDNYDLRDALGGDSALLDWFDTARKADPAAELFINDYNIIAAAGMDDRRQSAYYDTLKYLTDHNAPLDGIGVQGHFGNDLTPPERMLKILDRFAVFHKPLQVTEFDVEVQDQALQADFTRDFLIAVFSHPAVTGITLWGFWKNTYVGPDTPLYNDDWKPKPNALVYDDLVLHRWWTNADGATDASGRFAVRGFLGDYDITVTVGGKSVAKQVRLDKGGVTVRFTSPTVAKTAERYYHRQSLPPLRPKGDQFVDPSGKPVRFWGMNLIAFYPSHALADKTASNLASLGINLVRTHHNLRRSTDWDPANCASLATYQNDSRTPNPVAWDRYDYMNARLRDHGVYLALSIHGTRTFMPGDVSILHVSNQDDKKWSNAINDLTHWSWQAQFDPIKMLPVIDERCFLLNAEFARRLLTHVNPYTGLAYGVDPQVVSVEMVNEFSSEYTVLCQNKFPAYWTDRLNARLADFCKSRGLAPFGVYAAQTPEQRQCFADFFTSLDLAYRKRMEAVIRSAGYHGAVEFSNLWRGDMNLRMRAQNDDFIEDHAYEDPLIVSKPNMFLYGVSKSAVANKPLVIGELNQTENPLAVDRRRPVYTMLPAAAAAVASLQNYSGVVWFAWAHGILTTGPDGWGNKDPRNPTFPDIIGDLNGVGPILDHLRAAGMIFKNGYLQSSAHPQIVAADGARGATGYDDLMAGSPYYQPGWQLVHEFRKTFTAALDRSAFRPMWALQPPPNLTISDTGQIVCDSARRQLSFSAEKAEGFSGYLDGKAPEKLSVLGFVGASGFATVLAVSLDDRPLKVSKHILVSKTYTAAGGAESPDLGVTLDHLAAGHWAMSVTRPFPFIPAPKLTHSGDRIALPQAAWNECELTRS